LQEVNLKCADPDAQPTETVASNDTARVRSNNKCILYTYSGFCLYATKS